MNHSKLIDELLQELSYRVGIVDIYNKEHQSIISEILTEWGEFEAKEKIFNFLNEEDREFTNPILNKKIKYVGKDGKEKEGTVGNLLTAPKDSPGRIEAEKQLPAEGTPEREELNKEIGSQGGGGPQDNQKGGNKSEEDLETKKNVQKTFNTPSQKAKRKKEKETREKLEKDESDKTSQTSPSEEEIKLAKEDASKVLKQILMTTSEAKKQQKGVGLGTPESRTGESVTVYAGQRIQQLMKSGKSYAEAREEIEKELMTIANDKNNVLTPEWVQSGLAVFDHLNDVYGFENIKNFAWDTPQGNKLVGATDHGTSADMFIQLKDGTTIGVSLKKDFKVFIVNGGYAKAMKEFEDKTGVSFSEKCQVGHYMSRRDSILANSEGTIEGNKQFFKEKIDSILSDPAEFEKTFGKRAVKNRKSFLVAKKLGISIEAAKKMSDEERDDVMKTITSEDVLSYIQAKSDTSNDRIKFMANIFKRKDVNSKFGIYSELRGLDNEMTENMFEDIKSSPEKEQKLKEKIIEDTHIIDTLFPKEPLGDFKTVFGTDPAVEMTRSAIVSIFGIKDLWDSYNDVKTDEEKQQIREQIEKEITSKLKIEKKSGVPVIAIVLKNEDGSESILPLYKLGVRTRGIGDSPTLEVAQATFGSLALKNGNTNIESWDDKDKNTVVNGELSDILSLFEDPKNPSLDELSDEQIEDIKERIKLLETYNPKSKKLKDLKKLIGID
jgi:hypothetical protein